MPFCTLTDQQTAHTGSHPNSQASYELTWQSLVCSKRMGQKLAQIPFRL